MTYSFLSAMCISIDFLQNYISTISIPFVFPKKASISVSATTKQLSIIHKIVLGEALMNTGTLIFKNYKTLHWMVR